MWSCEVTEFNSGLRVVSCTLRSVQSVTVGIWSNIGSRQEKQYPNGTAHFLEHVVFKGTTHRSAKQITSQIEGCGGYLNAVTSEESTCYYARARAENLPLLVEVLGDIYLNAELAPEQIEIERGVISEEIQMYNEQPATVAQEQLNLCLWPNDPLGRPITGTLASLQQITRDHLLAFRHNMFSSRNTWVVGVGNVTHQQLCNCVQRTFGGWQGCYKPVRMRNTSFQNPTYSALTTQEEQVQIAVGFRGLHRDHPDRFALRVLSILLAENMSSRLFQRLREDHGWAYSVGSHVQLFRGTGALVITAGVIASKWKPALDLILRECSRLATKRVSSKELSQARQYAIGNLWLTLESSTEVMFWIGESLVSYQKILPPEHVEKQFACVTVEDISRVAAKLFRPQNRAVVLTGPNINQQRLHERLLLHA